jgi:hypothetical protein
MARASFLLLKAARGEDQVGWRARVRAAATSEER